jgi:ComF family protein
LQDLPLIGSRCTVCALPLANAVTCGDCLKNPKPYQRTLCALRYENPVNYLINRFKNHTQWQIGDFLCDQWLKQNAEAAVGSVDSVIVAIPSHPKQSAKRGFTPSVYIAENFSKRLGIPIVPLLKARYEATPQKSLNRQQRLGNLKDVFEAQPFPGKKVILVDDVVTSCATTIAASHALARVGVESIEIWALARTPFD